MHKQLKPRAQRVIISDHAWSERWPERAGIKINKAKLAKLLRWKLTEGARGAGLYLDATGAAWVEVFSWLWAVARLTDEGWVVTTFVVWDVDGCGEGMA
jgi:hypothetical protein